MLLTISTSLAFEQWLNDAYKYAGGKDIKPYTL